MTQTNTWAMATLCREACLHAGPHLDLCRKVFLNGALGGPMWTWLCADAEFVVLLRDRDTCKFLVYLCSTDMVYFAKEGYEFRATEKDLSKLPGATDVQALIGQFIVDRGADGNEIGRLLVFDLVSGGSVAERHAALLQLECGHNITKQWVGNKDALSPAFLQSLPHSCTGLIGLTNCPYIYEKQELF